MDDQKVKILVVDDEAVVLKSCEKVLKPYGYAVKTTTSPHEALGAMREGPFDLLITDIRMPEMEGLDLIRQAREILPDLLVLMVTGYPSQESLKTALSLRVVDYLPKPFSPSILVESVQNALAIKKKGAVPEDEEEPFTEEIEKKINEVIARYKGQPGNAIPVLIEAQRIVSSLTPVVLRHIASGLNITISELHGVVSFYSFFSLKYESKAAGAMKPKGKHNIKVCMGTACFVKRAEEIISRLKDTLGIDLGEVTDDRMFSLDSVRCQGACGMAPVVVINDDTKGGMDPDKMLEYVEQQRAAKGGANV